MKQLLCGAHFNGDNWYDALPLAEMAINNAPLPNSSYSAYYLNYGFHLCCEADVFNFGHPANDQLEPNDDMMEEFCETSGETANKHRHEHEIQIGDGVLISLRQHDAATLSALPRGPFVVLKQTARNAFHLALPEAARRAQVHDVFNVRQLKKYHSATPKIDSLESEADSLGDCDESSGRR